MTFFESVWAAAAETFGKKRGQRNPLTPYTRTWRLVLERADHALWHWNNAHGPLNQVQREYAAELVVLALTKAQEAPDCNAVYAFYQAKMMQYLNHEDVQAGFRRRAESEKEASVDASSIFGQVAA